MGLASKFAATQATSNFQQTPHHAPGGHQWPPSPQGQYVFSNQSAAPQQQPLPPSYAYQSYGQASYTQPHGQPHTQPQGSVKLPSSLYYAPQQPVRNNPAAETTTLFAILKEAVEENALHQFYNDQRLQQLAADISRKDPVSAVCQHWKIPLEIGFDLVKLSLYDTVFLLDDSGSIEFSGLQNELKSILKSTAFATSLFDQDGFSVRFMNSNIDADNIRTESQAEDLLNRISYSGKTPLVTSLRDKILRKYLGSETGSFPSTIRKPLLVIIITDGIPTDNRDRAFQKLISIYKTKPVSFQIAQVGVDQDAQDFLSSLDSDPEIGRLIDCTSNFEMESAEFSRINPQIKLTRELWYTKLLLGSIDKTYDSKDEKTPAMPPPKLPANATSYETYQQPPAPLVGQQLYQSQNPQHPIQLSYQQSAQPAFTQQYHQQLYSQGGQPGYGQTGMQAPPHSLQPGYPSPQSYGQQQQMPQAQNLQYLPQNYGQPHNSPGQGSNLNYSQSQQTEGVYTGTEPPTSYKPNSSYRHT